MARAIVLNGTSQKASIDFPNSAPWNSMGAFKIIFRMRGFNSSTDRKTLAWTNGGGGQVLEINTGSGSSRLDFSDLRDSISIFHTPTSFSDVVVKLQFDPSNSRWTMESWKGDGNGYVVGTVGLTTTSNHDLSGVLHIGTSAVSTLWSNGHFDWFAVQSGVDALSADNFPGAELAAGTYLALWTFDSDNGNDSSGNGLTLTLTGSPTFEDTPPELPVVPDGLQLSIPESGTVRLKWWDRSGNESSFNVERSLWLTPQAREFFTDTDGTELTAHDPVDWLQPSYGNVGKGIINTNRLTKDSNSSQAIYYINDTFSNDQVIEARITMMSSISVNVALVLCLDPASDTYYHFRHNRDSNNWTIRRTLLGSSVQLDDWSETLIAGDVRVARFEREGSTLRGYVDDVLRCEFTDTNITGGKVGLRFGGAASTSTGYAIDYLQAYDFQAWTELDSLAPGTTTFDDDTVSPSTDYWYRVIAENVSGTVDSVRKRIRTPPSDKKNLRVVSANLFFNTGTDGVHNIDRTAQYLANYNADLIGCCEAPNTDVADLVDALETKTGLTWYSFHVGKTLGADEGNLILSKYPFISTDELFLSSSRSVAQVTVSIHGRIINFFATHLQNGQTPENAAIRATQIGELLPWVEGFSEPRIMVGDFNSTPSSTELSSVLTDYYSGWAEALSVFRAYSYAANPEEENTRTRTIQIDFGFLSKTASDISIRQAQIVDTRNLNDAAVTEIIGTRDDEGVRPSDHNPVVVDFDLVAADFVNPPTLFRGRNFMFFDDEQLNRYEFWPAIDSGDVIGPFVIFGFGGR